MPAASRPICDKVADIEASSASRVVLEMVNSVCSGVEGWAGVEAALLKSCRRARKLRCDKTIFEMPRNVELRTRRERKNHDRNPHETRHHHLSRAKEYTGG